MAAAKIRAGERNSIRSAFAWFGFLMVAVSLAWLEILPPLERTASHKRPRQQQGALGVAIIDPGHGGQDSGAIRNGILEKDLTLDVARRVERLSRARGFTTIMTRSGDDWISLAGRVAIANRERDGIFVSIHFDEGQRVEATGVQTFYAAKQTPKMAGVPSWFPFFQPVSSVEHTFGSQSLAGFVQDSLVARTQAFNRGTRAEQFFVVARTRHPAVLVEGGFLSNNADAGKLMTDNYREALATAITEGMVRYREIEGQGPATLAVGNVGSE